MSKSGAINYLAGRLDNVEKWLRRLENTLAFSWVYERKIHLNTSNLNLKDDVYKEKVLMKTNILFDHYTSPMFYFLTYYQAELNPMSVEFKP
jgi:hypothetical protein